MPDQSGSLKLGGTAKSLSEKKKEKKTEVLTKQDRICGKKLIKLKLEI